VSNGDSGVMLADGEGTDDVWAEQNTTPDAIDDALRRLLRERHRASATLAPARVLNLVVIVDREWKGETANRLERVGRYHASRTVLCAVEDSRATLDARATLHHEQPRSGVGLIRERVEIDLGRRHLSHLDTIIDPVLVSELPTVLWSPHGHDEAAIALRGMADVVLVDSDDVPDPSEALERAERHLDSAYVVDLAWLRTTPWRERLAASFDSYERRRALREAVGLVIEHRLESRASALLVAGWLASRLGWEPAPLTAEASGQTVGTATRPGQDIRVQLDPADQATPGLRGVSIACGGAMPLAISLQRASGGLCANEILSDGRRRTWQVLGASRGEGGILGEGVRQALLRDVTYGPALTAARGFSPG
jgi:glucose-6-phosphate dehydrogenase assembly protein OpcA